MISKQIKIKNKRNQNLVTKLLRDTEEETLPSPASLPQCKLPFRQDMLRLWLLARLVGAKDTRRAARVISS